MAPFTPIRTEKFPESDAFLRNYITPSYARSTYRVGAYSFNIKAPNFRQDIGYIGFIESPKNHALLGQQLIDLARYITPFIYSIFTYFFIRSNKLNHALVVVAIVRDLDNLISFSRPIKAYASAGIKRSFGGF